LYAIIRGDLDMPPGKAAAQCGHAFLDTFLKAHAETPSHATEYLGDRHGTKCVLKAKNLNQLLRAKEEAERAGLPCALITDSGHILPPHFDGNPIITALGIGPARRSDIHHITKRFSSL
jgi:PTH2 family peptidyl-tRNA hydrolase